MEEKSFKDRRKFIRFENTDVGPRTNTLGKFKMPDDIMDSVAMGLSPEGISFRSKEPLKPGLVTEVSVAIPFQSRPLSLKGEVRWSKPIKLEGGGEVYETGMKLQIGETDEGRFLLYICSKLTERIKALEEQLPKEPPK